MTVLNKSWNKKGAGISNPNPLIVLNGTQLFQAGLYEFHKQRVGCCNRTLQLWVELNAHKPRVCWDFYDFG
jgi:hypothetical protein